MTDVQLIIFSRKETAIEFALRYLTTLMAQLVKNLPAMTETKETRVRSLVWEDPLEEGMTTHSSILAGKSMDRGAWQATVHRVTVGTHGTSTELRYMYMYIHICIHR